MFVPFLIASLLLWACEDSNPSESAPGKPPEEEQSLLQDTLPSYDSALGYFEASRSAFDGDRYRKASDFIVAGVEELASGQEEASEADARQQSLQELDRMAARLSRFELEGDEEDTRRSFAKALMEMDFLLLQDEELTDSLPAEYNLRLLAFSIETLRRADPFLPGSANETAGPLIEQGESLLDRSKKDPAALDSTEARRLLGDIRAFLENVKGEIR